MRITTARRPRPSTAHIACLTRKIDGRPYRCAVTTAEAEYTITMLRLSNSNVAVNSHLSDFNFLATPYSPSTFRPKHFLADGLRSFVSGQQSSVGLGRRHQLPEPGQ